MFANGNITSTFNTQLLFYNFTVGRNGTFANFEAIKELWAEKRSKNIVTCHKCFFEYLNNDALVASQEGSPLLIGILSVSNHFSPWLPDPMYKT
jgi:hypothetical protein